MSARFHLGEHFLLIDGAGKSGGLAVLHRQTVMREIFSIRATSAVPISSLAFVAM